MHDELIRREFQKLCSILQIGINAFISERKPYFETSFEIGHKTISEIGGRFIEEYITLAIRSSELLIHGFTIESLSSRSLGDFSVRTKNGVTFYIDIKTQHISIRERTLEYYQSHDIKQKKPGESHPNLISYQKAVDFFSDYSKAMDDIGILLIKYDPSLNKGRVDFNISKIEEKSIILLRDFSEQNLSYGDLGKGQIQLSRINNLNYIQRSKKDFLQLINDLKKRPRKVRNSPKV